jgi:hypothetical protein
VNPDGHVIELSWENHWLFTDLTLKTKAPAAPTGTALTSFGVGGSASRVYYLDATGHVIEFAFVAAITKAGIVAGWNVSDVTALAKAPAGSPGSALTCFGVGGTASRVYYLQPDEHVAELRWTGKWKYSDVTAAAGAAPAAAGSALTCFGVNNSVSRVYYLNEAGHVCELAWQGQWINTDATAQAKAASADAGSALTCFGVNSFVPRVYYLQANGHVSELAWQGIWVGSDVTPQAGAAPAELDSALTCFGAGGSSSRVYYLQENNHVFELAWLTGVGWVSTDVTLQAGAAPTKDRSPLTCFGANGSSAVVNCLDASNQVVELTWEDRWAASVIS